MSLDNWLSNSDAEVATKLNVVAVAPDYKYAFIARLSFLTIAGWIGYSYLMGPKLVVSALKRNALPIGFACWETFSCVWASNPLATLNIGLRLIVFAFSAAILVERFQAREIARVLLYAGLVTLLLNIAVLIIIPSQSYDVGIYSNAWRGTLTQKNYFGALMAFIVIISIHTFRLGVGGRPFSLAVLLIASLCLVMSKSATAMIATTLAVGVVLLMGLSKKCHQTKDRRLILFLVLGTVTVVFTLFAAGLNPAELVGKSGDLTGRTLIWPVVWDLIQQRPLFGYGNNFWASDDPLKTLIWLQCGWQINHAHNTFLDLWFQLGIPGLILGVWLLGRLLIYSFREFLVGGAVDALLWCGLFVIVFVRCFAESVMTSPAIEAIFWLSLAHAGLRRLQMQRNVRAGRTSERLAIPSSTALVPPRGHRPTGGLIA